MFVCLYVVLFDLALPSCLRRDGDSLGNSADEDGENDYMKARRAFDSMAACLLDLMANWSTNASFSRYPVFSICVWGVCVCGCWSLFLFSGIVIFPPRIVVVEFCFFQPS